MWTAVSEPRCMPTTPSRAHVTSKMLMVEANSHQLRRHAHAASATSSLLRWAGKGSGPQTRLVTQEKRRTSHQAPVHTATTPPYTPIRGNTTIMMMMTMMTHAHTHNRNPNGSTQRILRSHCQHQARLTGRDLDHAVVGKRERVCSCHVRSRTAPVRGYSHTAHTRPRAGQRPGQQQSIGKPLHCTASLKNHDGHSTRRDLV